MRSQDTTLLVYFERDGGKLEEYPVKTTGSARLGDEFKHLACRASTAVLMASLCGLEPPWTRGKVYGYIMNRDPQYRAAGYGHGRERQ
jgi:hypothetical protein